MELIVSPAGVRSRTAANPVSEKIGFRRKLVASAFETLRSVGVFSLAGRSRRRRGSLLILCYHGISLRDEHIWRPDLYVTAEQFRDRLACLREQNASVLGLEEALLHLRSGTLPPKSVAITFDDGFYDFAEQAAPALGEYNYPSTLYLTTHYTNYQLPISNLALDYILWKSGLQTVTLPEYGIAHPALIAGAQARFAAVLKIRDHLDLQGVDTAGKDEAAARLAHRLHVDYSAMRRSRMLQIMNPREVRQVSGEGVNIQLHTHRHRMPREETLFIREIEENRNRIAALTGKTPSHFCYPSGAYSPGFAGWLKKCGVVSATTCEKGLALPSSESMRLPRVLDDSRLGTARFESILSGLFV